MLFIVNALHVEYETVIKTLQDNRIPYDSANSVEDACKKVEKDEGNNDKVVFVGFIYKESEVSDYVKNIDNKFFITNIGHFPEDFTTPSLEDEDISLLEQLTKEGLIDKKSCEVKDNLGQFLYYKDEETSNFVNFKPYNDLFNPFKTFNISYVEYSMLKVFSERAYNVGNTYFIYENNPINKLFLAHMILEDVDKGLVVIGSQTRSNNDMLTFYGKGINMYTLADKFNVEVGEDSNIFNVFILSHVNVLGKQITDFISEGI